MAFRMLHLKVFWTAVQHGPIHDESALWRQQNIGAAPFAASSGTGSGEQGPTATRMWSEKKN